MIANTSKYFQIILSSLICFLFSLLISSPIIGSFFAFTDLHWGSIAVSITFIASTFLSFTIYPKIYKILSQDKLITIFTTIILLLLTTYIYKDVSPVIEIRQDPALYMYKSFNLLNYGHIYQPFSMAEKLYKGDPSDKHSLRKYASVQNATWYDGKDKLHLDFFPAGSFFYAIVGFWAKHLTFYGPLFVMLAVALVFFIFLRQFFDPFSSLLLSSIYLISPAVIWFGRAPYSELYYFFLLFAILLFLNQDEDSNKSFKSFPQLIFIFLAFIAGYHTRIDFLFPLFIGVVIFTRQNPIRGLVFTLSAILTVIFVKHTYFLYTLARLTFTENMFIFKYDVYLLLVTYLICVTTFKYYQINFNKVLNHRIIKLLLITVVGLISLLMFRDDLTPLEYLKTGSARGNIIRIYDEEIFDRLFLVFPSFILIIGLIYFPFLTKPTKLNTPTKLLLFGMFIIYLTFFLKARNSPQMYWVFRRYIHVIIPLLLLSFGFFAHQLNKVPRIIILIVGCLLTINMTSKINLQPEMKGLDKTVIAFTQKYKENQNYLLLYHDDLRYWISSILSYGKYDFFPVRTPKFLADIIAKAVSNKILYLFPFPTGASPQLCDTNKIDNFTISYERQGEDYESLPKKRYKRAFKICIMELTNKKDLFQAMILSATHSGFTTDRQWTTGDGIIQDIKFKLENYPSFLKIERIGFFNPLFNSKNAPNPKVSINNIQLKLYKKQDKKYIYSVNNNIKEINNIKIKTAHFVPNDTLQNGDNRQLGLDIKNIDIIETPDNNGFKTALALATFTGFYGQLIWTNGKSYINHINYKIPYGRRKLALIRKGYNHPLIDDPQKLNLKLFINNVPLKHLKTDGNKFIFKIDDSIKIIKNIIIKSNTFVPNVVYSNGDKRHLGIDIKELKLLDD